MDWLNDKNVAFTEHDVSTDRTALQEMIKKSGQLGVPVIDIDGKVTVGFDRAKLEELLTDL